MPDLPYEIERASWSKDGKSIFFLANMGVHAELFEVSAEGGKPRQLTNGKHAIAQWNLATAANQHVFTALEMTSPGEVWIMDAGRILAAKNHLGFRISHPRLSASPPGAR